MSKKKRSHFKKEIKSFRVLSALAICALLSGAVAQLNLHIHQNSLIGDLKKNIVAVSEENDILESRLSKSNSLDDFNQYRVAQEENYEKVDIDGVRYVYVSENELAKK